MSQIFYHVKIKIVIKLEIIHEVNKTLVVINDDYKKMIGKDNSKSSPYSLLNEEGEYYYNREKQHIGQCG